MAASAGRRLRPLQVLHQVGSVLFLWHAMGPRFLALLACASAHEYLRAPALARTSDCLLNGVIMGGATCQSTYPNDDQQCLADHLFYSHLFHVHSAYAHNACGGSVHVHGSRGGSQGLLQECGDIASDPQKFNMSLPGKVTQLTAGSEVTLSLKGFFHQGVMRVALCFTADADCSEPSHFERYVLGYHFTEGTAGDASAPEGIYSVELPFAVKLPRRSGHAVLQWLVDAEDVRSYVSCTSVELVGGAELSSAAVEYSYTCNGHPLCNCTTASAPLAGAVGLGGVCPQGTAASVVNRTSTGTDIVRQYKEQLGVKAFCELCITNGCPSTCGGIYNGFYQGPKCTNKPVIEGCGGAHKTALPQFVECTSATCISSGWAPSPPPPPPPPTEAIRSTRLPLTRAHAPRDAPAPKLSRGAGAALKWTLEEVRGAGSTACLKSIALGGPGGSTRYIVGEGGVVLKGDVGGGPLKTIRDDGFPNYYYGAGVARVAQREVLVVSGFVDGSKPPLPPKNLGVALTSVDGGATWLQRTIVSNGTWLGGPVAVLYPDTDEKPRLVVPAATAIPVFSAPLDASGAAWPWATTKAGSGWHAGPMVVGPAAGQLVLTGTQMCRSADGAKSFTCASPADATFDGGVAAQSSNGSNWLTGGGTIAPDIAGWVHRSGDGGTTFAARSLETPYPIRWVGFACGPTGTERAFAAGGNFFTQVGGIWSSADLGATWTLEAETGAEMSACAAGLGFVTCVGAARGAQSVVATAKC